MFSQRNFSFFLILVVCFIDVVGVGLVYPMFSSMLFQADSPFVSAEVSDTVKGAYLGVLLAIMPLTHFFSAPILGMLSDQKGRKTILAPALSVGVLGYLMALIAVYTHSLLLLLISRVAVGISAGTAAVVQAVLADLSKPEEKAKNFALLNMVFGLGFTIGPFLGGVLSDMDFGFIQGYALPFALAGIVMLANCLMTLFFFKETYTPKPGVKISFLMGITNIRKALQVRNLRVLFGGALIASLGWSFYWEFTPVSWIMTYGFSVSMIGNLYAYGAAIYALSCGVLIRPILSRYAPERVLCWGLYACALSISLLLLLTDQMWVWFYIPFQQFAIALFWPTIGSLVSNAADNETQGETLGVLQSMEGLAFGLSPLIAGPLLGISPMMPIVVGGMTILIAGTLFSLFLESKTETITQQ